MFAGMTQHKEESLRILKLGFKRQLTQHLCVNFINTYTFVHPMT